MQSCACTKPVCAETFKTANPGHQSDARQMREQREKRGAGDAQSGPRSDVENRFSLHGRSHGRRESERETPVAEKRDTPIFQLTVNVYEELISRRAKKPKLNTALRARPFSP
jgi:hypothetical protein